VQIGASRSIACAHTTDGFDAIGRFGASTVTAATRSTDPSGEIHATDKYSTEGMSRLCCYWYIWRAGRSPALCRMIDLASSMLAGSRARRGTIVKRCNLV
jgi:hypothetical protein